MLSLLVSSLALQVGRAPTAHRQLLKLRGGLSADQVRAGVAYLTLGQGLVGYPFTKEVADLYEFTSPVEQPTKAFAKMNFAMSIAHAVMLLSPDNAIPALAMAIYFSSPVMEDLKAPRLPMVAWSAALVLMQMLTDAGVLPGWLIPVVLIGSGLHGAFFWEQVVELYQIGTVGLGPRDKFSLTKQSASIGQFVNGGFVAFGVAVLAQTMELSDARVFAGYALTFGAFVVKLMFDGDGVFNPAGAYAWAALFGFTGLLSLFM